VSRRYLKDIVFLKIKTRIVVGVLTAVALAGCSVRRDDTGRLSVVWPPAVDGARVERAATDVFTLALSGL
jgi:hypothetical protein